MPLSIRFPFDDRVVAELEPHTPDQIEARVAAAVHAQVAWRALPIDERVAAVALGVDWFRRNAEDVARDVTLQMGKPLAQARGEVGGLLERAEHLLSIARETLAPDVLPEKPGFTRRIEHVPLGVVLDVAAWNYPLLIPVNVIVPALLAGNAVLLKHSARTPLCGAHFEQAFAEACPAGLLAQLVIGHDDTARLIRDPRIAHVSFTGSVGGGQQIQRVVAERFIDAGLELGGNDPAYVAADADLESTVAGVVDGACYNAGQSCCGVERVYVHERVADEFLARATELVDAYRLGDPLHESTTLGPLASAGALPGLAAQVRGARDAGARVLCGGASVDGRFFQATLLEGCPNHSEIMQEESFGPLVPVLRVADDDEALIHMNDTRFGLTASIWTADRGRAEWFAARHDAGTIYQNRCDYLDPALPWTGYRDSGRGSTLSSYGFRHLTRRKAIHFRDPS